MRTDLWNTFHGLIPGGSRILATVVTHNGDGTASLITADGNTLRAWGRVEGSTPPYNVFVRDGKVEAPAPNLALLEIEV